jgi:V/A-type H+-transporting ATPase subunit A
MDTTYLQQNAFNDVDAATSGDRQCYVFSKLNKMLKTKMSFPDQAAARTFFQRLTQMARDWNGIEMESEEFKKQEELMDKMLAEVSDYAE